jgi:hypothetical protein
MRKLITKDQPIPTAASLTWILNSKNQFEVNDRCAKDSPELFPAMVDDDGVSV